MGAAVHSIVSIRFPNDYVATPKQINKFNLIMKRKCKQWMSTIPHIHYVSTKRITTSQSKLMNTIKTTTYVIGNPDP